jgi:hypothetical protein
MAQACKHREGLEVPFQASLAVRYPKLDRAVACGLISEREKMYLSRITIRGVGVNITSSCSLSSRVLLV